MDASNINLMIKNVSSNNNFAIKLINLYDSILCCLLDSSFFFDEVTCMIE